MSVAYKAKNITDSLCEKLYAHHSVMIHSLLDLQSFSITYAPKLAEPITMKKKIFLVKLKSDLGWANKQERKMYYYVRYAQSYSKEPILRNIPFLIKVNDELLRRIIYAKNSYDKLDGLCQGKLSREKFGLEAWHGKLTLMTRVPMLFGSAEKECKEIKMILSQLAAITKK
ncbi:MAG: hypothetical protein Q8O89_06545 [Nanoarchaeota archaeon]|nr:hypothetical protein [Nanoarchaeota archaeon]